MRAQWFIYPGGEKVMVILPTQLKLKKIELTQWILMRLKRKDFVSTSYVQASYGHRYNRNKILRLICTIFSTGGKGWKKWSGIISCLHLRR